MKNWNTYLEKFNIFENKNAHKIGVISALFAIISGMYAFFIFTTDSEPQSIDDSLYGIWYSNYSYDITHGEYFIEGTTEYFKNNTFNFNGQVKTDILFNYVNYLVTYNVDAAGTWSSDSDSFLTTIKSFNSFPMTVEFENEKINIQMYEEVSGKKFPDLDKSVPIGSSEEFKVVNFGKNKITVEVDDLKGNPIQFLMTKQDRRFQR